MSRTPLAWAVVCAALGLGVSQAGLAANVTLRGASSCAVWTAERAQNRAQYEKAWLSGYFSGLAMGTDVNFWGTQGRNEIDNEAVWQWFDTYCAANPKNNLVSGAEKLFLERFRVVTE